MITKELTINAIVISADHGELQLDGYSAKQDPPEYSYAHFKIPLEDVGRYKVGMRMTFVAAPSDSYAAKIPADVAEFQKSPQMQAEVEDGPPRTFSDRLMAKAFGLDPVAEGNAAELCKATLTEEGSTYRCAGKVGHSEPHSNGDWEWSDNVDIVLGPVEQVHYGSTITDLVDKTLGCGALQRHLDSRGGCD
jgi:hypothetical protein